MKKLNQISLTKLSDVLAQEGKTLKNPGAINGGGNERSLYQSVGCDRLTGSCGTHSGME